VVEYLPSMCEAQHCKGKKKNQRFTFIQLLHRFCFKKSRVTNVTIFGPEDTDMLALNLSLALRILTPGKAQ
jgi:hypothetical protein